MRLNEDEVKIREKAGMLLLSVRVQPGATSDQIVGSYNGALKIRLAAPAQRNRANTTPSGVFGHHPECTCQESLPEPRTVFSEQNG